MPLPVAPLSASASDSVPDFTNRWVVRGASTDLSIGMKDPYGVLWDWTDLQGWFATPSMDTPITPLGTSDRAIAASKFPLKERYVTIKGVCHINTEDDNWIARERLNRAWDSPNEEFWLIVEEPVPKRMRVRSAGPIEAPWNPTETLWFTFDIPLVATNPLKFGLDAITGSTSPVAGGEFGLEFDWVFPLVFSGGTESAPGHLFLYNEGDADTFPILTLTGPLARGWRVQNLTSDQSISFDVALGEGQSLVIDMEKHSATVSGTSVNVKISGDWFPLKSGENQLLFTTPQANDTAVLSVSAYSAYK